jgi:hypothetical protein
MKDLQANDLGNTILYKINKDETGKYKTNKCTIELFLSTAAKHGIEATENIKDGLKERTIPGSQGVVDYAKAIRELHLRINQNFADENISTKSSIANRL